MSPFIIIQKNKTIVCSQLNIIPYNVVCLSSSLHQLRRIDINIKHHIYVVMRAPFSLPSLSRVSKCNNTCSMVQKSSSITSDDTTSSTCIDLISNCVHEHYFFSFYPTGPALILNISSHEKNTYNHTHSRQKTWQKEQMPRPMQIGQRIVRMWTSSCWIYFISRRKELF